MDSAERQAVLFGKVRLRRFWIGATPMTNPTTDASLDRLEADVLAVAPELTVEQVADTLGRLDYMAERIKKLKADLEPRLFAYVDANGPFEIGPMRYCIKTEKKTKCVNVPGALNALLDACAGDFDELCKSLSASPIKYGDARTRLGDEKWSQFFEVIEQRTLDDKPVKSVTKVDTRFLK
jgi:hypothetical protein